MKKAFSLVELSIVLVILGLLVGGILAGQSLIRASELRAVTADIQRFQTAVNAFRDKYFAVPGDMTNATSVWGKDSTNCNGQTGTANATTGTCNGDGNGQADYVSTWNITVESYQLWRQLALAGLIEGTYSGIAGLSASAVLGVNLPASKISGAYALNYYTSAGDTWNYPYNYGNQLSLLTVTGAGVLKPEEAWNIDTKLDDGKPAYGKFIALLLNNCTTSSSFSDLAGEYRLTNTAQTACGFRYRNMI